MHLTVVAAPTLVLSLTVWAYWTIVAVMVVRRRRNTRTLSGTLPEQRVEALMWLLWVPLVGAWLVLPLLAQARTAGAFALPAFATSDAYTALRLLAAVVAIAALCGSIRCWRQMGRHWTMAVTRDESSTLLTGGMFARVRHPIYALSILLMLATLVVLPNVPVLAIAVVHIALMNAKARNEERFMLAAHHDEYTRYCDATGRFLPRIRAHP